jgi:hypothetical protein
MRMSAPARLDPVGRLRLPRRTTMLRLAVVAVLLLTAAGVLYTGDGPGRTDPQPPEAADQPEPVAEAAGRLPIPDGMVGVPVPLGDPASLALLRPGDRVDLLAVSATGGHPAPLADDTPVLAVDSAAAVLMLALEPEQGRAVVSAPAGTVFAILLRSTPLDNSG